MFSTNYRHLKGRPYDINYLLYTPIEQRIGKKSRVIKKYDFYEEEFEKKQKNKQQSSYRADLLQPTITSISHDTISAGTNSILTINGTNFDSTTMKVQFLNANNGGAVLLNRL